MLQRPIAAVVGLSAAALSARLARRFLRWEEETPLRFVCTLAEDCSAAQVTCLVDAAILLPGSAAAGAVANALGLLIHVHGMRVDRGRVRRSFDLARGQAPDSLPSCKICIGKYISCGVVPAPGHGCAH